MYSRSKELPDASCINDKSHPVLVEDSLGNYWVEDIPNHTRLPKMGSSKRAAEVWEKLVEIL